MAANTETPEQVPSAPGLSRTKGDLARTFFQKYGLILVLLFLPVYYGIQDLKNDGNLSHLANNLFSGLSNGSIIALIAIGYTLVYGIIELINFAHGDVFMIGSFTAQQVWHGILGVGLATSTFGIVGGIAVALIGTMLVCGGVKGPIGKGAHKPVRQAPQLAPPLTPGGMS